jgi:two-component sensor histidine kinase
MNIDLVLAVHPLPLESSRCWRLGMIAAELMTNAASQAPASAGNEEYGARTPGLDRTSELPWR